MNRAPRLPPMKTFFDMRYNIGLNMWEDWESCVRIGVDKILY